MAKKINVSAVAPTANTMDELFSSTAIPQQKKGKPSPSQQGFEMIPLEKLVPNKYQKFKPRDKESLQALADSIKEVGILNALIVKPLDNGNYVIISGERRSQAAKLAGLKEVPCKIFIPKDEYQEKRVLGDANLNRPYLYPSEKGWIYRYQLEDLKHQGKSDDLSSIDGERSIDMVAEQADDSASQIRRFIRLTYLNQNLLNMVDDEMIPVSAGVTLTKLSSEEQTILADIIKKDKVKVSAKDADSLILASKKKKLTTDSVLSILKGEVKPRASKNTDSKGTSFSEKAFSDLVPDDIKKLPVIKRVSYHRRALEVFADYLKKHPEELKKL